jgi:exopolyphosphatase/guanosine-5'-triphosphate,3'-diphosphate pyrophosphatase
LKLAAIDIGSNACRLLIQDVIQMPQGGVDFAKVALIRVPLRLGFDVFETGSILEHRAYMLLNTMRAYKLLLDVYEVSHLKACATSAMRDANNAAELISDISNETGIDIKVITGQEEASFIYENHIAENLTDDSSYLYIDVGGGSTELTYFNKGKMVCKESFNIGTIRILKNQVHQNTWDELKNFIRKNISNNLNVKAIGSGGNINKIFSLSKRKEGKALPFSLLQDYYKEFSALTIPQRISFYKLREDRADVIVPALLIYINVMRWANATEIFVPKIGLADGLIHILYDEVKAAQKSAVPNLS